MAGIALKKRHSSKSSPRLDSRSSVIFEVNHQSEVCTICYSDALPSEAVRLSCRHGWYCVHCMKQHADARLAVGDVCVPCPECREPVQDFCLKKFLSKDAIDGFHKRSLNLAVARSSNLFACPTPNCDMCVEVEAGDEAWLKKCPSCKKSACLRCGVQPYHRGLSCDEYAIKPRSKGLDAAQTSLRKWMRRTGTKQCPQCKMGVTKNNLKDQASQRSECHKMLCRHCGTKFCFKCLAVLTNSYTCGCSSDAHGFADPITGERLPHLQPKTSVAKDKSSRASGGPGPVPKSLAHRGRRVIAKTKKQDQTF